MGEDHSNFARSTDSMEFKMKKLRTDSKQFGVLRMFDQFLHSHGLDLSDQSRDEEFITKVSDALRKHRGDPILVHGLRIQTMFAYVAADLGGCRIIAEEDAGEFFVASPKLKRPDFRIKSYS